MHLGSLQRIFKTPTIIITSTFTMLHPFSKNSNSFLRFSFIYTVAPRMVPINLKYFYFSFYSVIVYDTLLYFLCVFESEVDLVSNKKNLTTVSCVWTKK